MSSVNGKLPDGFNVFGKSGGNRNRSKYAGDVDGLFVNKRGEVFISFELWALVGKPEAFLIGVEPLKRTAILVPTSKDTENCFYVNYVNKSSDGAGKNWKSAIRINCSRFSKEMRMIVSDHVSRFPVVVREGKILLDLKATPTIVK